MNGSSSTQGWCNSPEMPDDAEHCRIVSFGWAVGGGVSLHVIAWCLVNQLFYLQIVDYPSHTGVPLGSDDAPLYYLMEMHYDNPSGASGKFATGCCYVLHCWY